MFFREKSTAVLPWQLNGKWKVPLARLQGENVSKYNLPEHSQESVLNEWRSFTWIPNPKTWVVAQSNWVQLCPSYIENAGVPQCDNISQWQDVLCLPCSGCDALYLAAQLCKLESSALERKKPYISLLWKQAKVNCRSVQYVDDRQSTSECCVGRELFDNTGEKKWRTENIRI